MLIKGFKSGGPSEIRTQGGVTLAGFQDRCFRPTQPKIHLLKSCYKLEVPPRFELGIAALQAAALPLGDGTSHHLYVDMVPGAGLEPAQYCYRGILSPLRLPISPPGHVNEFTVFYNINFKWSGKRGSNSRPQPWQGCALPLSYSRNPTLAYLSK